uniref:RRM domain-containing protein n=1 Tax=Ciona savignyi TaxID=51511 RepID=H2Y5W2_CIOSA
MDIRPTHTIYANNLNEKIKKEGKSLYAIFSQFGQILDIVALKTLKMRGQAFVIFKEISSATNALRSMQGFPFYDKPMVLNLLAYSKKDSDVISKLKGTYQERTKEKKKKKKEVKKKSVRGGFSQIPKFYGKIQIKFDGVCPLTIEMPTLYNPYQINLGSCFMPNIRLKQMLKFERFSRFSQCGQGRTDDDGSKNPPNHILFLNNLPPETQEEMLNMLFNRFSGFKEVRLVPGRHDIAFVEFDSDQQASDAKGALQGFKISPTHAMKVTFAKK